MTARPVTNFIRQTDDRQTDRHTTDRQTKFLLHFLSPRGPKRGEKKFQLDRKKKEIWRLRDSGHIINFHKSLATLEKPLYTKFYTLGTKLILIKLNK